MLGSGRVGEPTAGGVHEWLKAIGVELPAFSRLRGCSSPKQVPLSLVLAAGLGLFYVFRFSLFVFCRPYDEVGLCGFDLLSSIFDNWAIYAQ